MGGSDCTEPAVTVRNSQDMSPFVSPVLSQVGFPSLILTWNFLKLGHKGVTTCTFIHSFIGWMRVGADSRVVAAGTINT